MNSLECTSQPSLDFDTPEYDPKDPRIPERIQQKITVMDIPRRLPAEGPCWVWTGAKGHGYGATFYQDKVMRSHRVIYMILRGSIPDGLEIDHICCNRECCNPAHLEAITHQLNLLRKTSYNVEPRDVVPRKKSCYRSKTHCGKGHEFTPENTYYKPKQNVRQCKACRAMHRKDYYWRNK